ncbi:MAG: cytochrome c3 family protein [Candidatus Nanopelagicales bacterium]|nr:cytochrome c3 family protein [Candidatus Nanopelagicales bacterium]MDZ4250127.1 cytochrome c3 family protein [Candidatus Nanopelagicales bacterium]
MRLNREAGCWRALRLTAWLGAFAMAVFASGLGSAVGTDGGPDPVPAPVGSDPAGLDEERVLTLEGSGITVTVPAGSLLRPASVEVARTRVEPGSKLLLSFTVVAKPLDGGGPIGEFAKPVQIEAALQDLPLGATEPADLSFAVRTNAGNWLRLPTQRSAEELAAEIGKPGSFAIVADGNLTVARHTFGKVVPSGASYLQTDTSLNGIARFSTFRVRFQMLNDRAITLKAKPRLEYRRSGAERFRTVPEKAELDEAFYVAREWNRNGQGRTAKGELGRVIPLREFLYEIPEGATGLAGQLSMGRNPDRRVEMEPRSATEQEFSVRVSSAADFWERYEFRVTDAGNPFAGEHTASLRIGGRAEVRLSPRQRDGRHTDQAGPRYRLESRRARSTAFVSDADERVHGPYSATSDQCATCHRAHVGAASSLLAQKRPQSDLCFTCHDGLGAGQDVKSEYTADDLPANNEAQREYYSHDALVNSSHTSGKDPEFAGALNRHSECGDCHGVHDSGTGGGAETEDGWTPSQRIGDASGVAVGNGAAGSSPEYTFLKDGVNLEYQLCFKCHSGYTELTSNSSLEPSQYALDKGTEFNPNNPSFHPIEAAGTNQTEAMSESLVGTSPYKLWNFTTGSTIRCSNCHGRAGAAPEPDGSLTPHTSRNRGILIRNYRDRVLKGADEDYAAADFALCLTCHAERPFVDGNGDPASDTNFRYHGLHLTDLGDEGSGGTDIDSPGAGQGNAICAECHFRIHSTTFSVGSQSIEGSRLVNFAPNVEGPPLWERAGSGGSCTLTCHGEEHDSLDY